MHKNNMYSMFYKDPVDAKETELYALFAYKE